MAEKNCFDMTKLVFLIMCVTVVQWSRSCLNVQINRVRRCFLFLCTVFFCLVSFFLTLFSLLTFFLYSYCWPCWSYTWINIYFKLKSGVLFWKRDFKSSWSPYWPSLRPDKTISCQDMPLLWNSWIFFNVSWHYDKQHTVHHKLYWFTPNTHQWPTGEKTCLLYIVLIINIISNT